MTEPLTTPNNPEWTPSASQRRVIARYAAPPWPSFHETARLESVAVNTARTWKKTNAFRVALEEARAESVAAHIETLDAQMLELGPRAIEALSESLDDDDVKVQTSSARWILEQILGAAKKRVEIAGAEGGPAVFTILIDNPANDKV